MDPRSWLRSLTLRLLFIMLAAMVAAMTFLVYSVLKEADYETEEVLDAWQFMVASDLLREVIVMLREGRHNDAWLAIETTRGLENTWLLSFSNPPDLLSFQRPDPAAKGREKEEVAAYIWLSKRDQPGFLGRPMPDFEEDWSGPGRRSIRTLVRDGHRWRVASVMDEEGVHRLFVAQRDDLRTYIAREIGNHLFRVQLLVLPFLIAVLALGIWRGLRPLSRLSRQIARRRPGNLQPVPIEGVPREVLPVVEEINRLLERLRLSLEAERAFTANAAHELRNPLAALRNLGQVLSEGRDLEQIRECGRLLERSAARMSTLLTQLLHLARLDAAEVDEGHHWCDLRKVVENSVGEMLPAAERRRMEIRYQARLEACIRMQPIWLEVLLGNLLNNAVKYGREGGKVVIRTIQDGDALRLEVLDDGPGVPAEQLSSLFERFYRVREARGRAEGAGLGLAIVRRIAELHEAEVWAENRRRGGLKVVVRFPIERWRRRRADAFR